MPLASLVLFTAALWGLHRLLAEISYADLAREIQGLSVGRIVLAFLFTAGSFIALTGYDWSALSYIGKRLPYRTVAPAALCGYAISNTVGFSLLSGGSVRYRLYFGSGLDGADIARLSLFSIIALGVGIHLVGAAALIIHPEIVASFFGVPPDLLQGVGIAALGLIGLLVLLTFYRQEPLRVGPWQLRLPTGPTTVLQVSVSVVDIVCAGACLYMLINSDQVPFLAFLVVYAVALMIGISSHVPGGLGVFESIMLLAFRNTLPAETLTAALVAYRAIYHLVPLAIATLVLVLRETNQDLPKVVGAARYLHALGIKLIPPALAGMTFLNGVVLLVSTATPAVPERLNVLEALVPILVLEVSNLGASVVGLALLIVARGLSRRLNGAYWLMLSLCVSGALLSFTKGIDYEEAVILLVTAFLAFLSRKEFYRRTRLIDAPFTLGWTTGILAAVIGMYWIVLFSYKHVEYAHALWWQFEYDAEASRSLRAALAVTTGLIGFALYRLLQAPRPDLSLPSVADLDKAYGIIRAQDDVDANLALMGDKHLLFSDDDDAFIMFGVSGQSWIALGDPVGRIEKAEELAWRFRELAEREGGRIAFYHARPESLPLYLDMGLTPLKLGEEAIVPLDTFALEGSRRKSLRQSFTRAQREGLTFAIIDRPAVPGHVSELKQVSDAWLSFKHTREKGFSLGRFHPDYIRRFDVAVVRHAGDIVAFANLISTDTKCRASIDLMRHRPEAPKNTMLFLFVHLMLYFKAQGFRQFTLGMAPLSGLETHPLAPLWHRVGHLIYNRAERLYSFQGLREFKDKFDPIWEPRYLATMGGISPILVITDTAALIGSGMHGVFRK